MLLTMKMCVYWVHLIIENKLQSKISHSSNNFVHMFNLEGKYRGRLFNKTGNMIVMIMKISMNYYDYENSQ